MEPISCRKEKRIFILESAVAVLLLAVILALILYLPVPLPEKTPAEYSSYAEGGPGRYVCRHPVERMKIGGIMRKNFPLVFLACSFLLFGIWEALPFSRQIKMLAAIDRMEGNRIMVEPLPEDPAYEKEANRIWVGMDGGVRLCGKYGQPLALGELRTGDVVEIHYDGRIMESDPRRVQAEEIRLFGDITNKSSAENRE